MAPVRRGHPAPEFMSDRDGDGVVCEAAGRNRDPVAAFR
ncbi:MAG: excalibur calcium-binding domain-containing protein [Acidobacteria bacterium]|nr:excalibur calcium-binding domain-containing protein [Acidobacteriota bacterium]